MRTVAKIIEDKNRCMSTVVNMCKEKPSTMPEIVDALGMGRSTVENYVLQLRRLGCIKSKRGQLVFYHYTGKDYVPVESRTENKWKRRKAIMHYCVNNRPTQHDLATMHKVSKDVIKSDMQYLAEIGAVEIDKPYCKKKHESATYRTIQVKPLNAARLSKKKNDQWTDMPEVLKRMFGVNEITPKGGKTYRNMDKLVRPEANPLRKVSAWSGYMSGMEMA